MPGYSAVPTDPSHLIIAMGRFYEAEQRYSASNTQVDRDALLKTLHPEIIVEQPLSLPYGGQWRGRASFGRWLDIFVDTWTDIRPVDAVHYPCSMDMLVSTVTMRARARATSLEITLPMCQIIQFREGLPVHWRNFAWDTSAMLNVLGLEGASDFSS